MYGTFLDEDYLAHASLRYAIKKHRAQVLHYDLRLAYMLSGRWRLVSFVLPEGPSLDPILKQCAIRVEDHRLGNMEFEGVISPAMGRGAGPVLVWDRGLYRVWSCITGRRVTLGTALREGMMILELEGMKLNGRFELSFARVFERQHWMLVKLYDDYAAVGSDIVEAQPLSVVSGCSLEEMSLKPSVRRKRDRLTGNLFDESTI
jgi:bifunctional non-homologous end joining protein LigD